MGVKGRGLSGDKEGMGVLYRGKQPSNASTWHRTGAGVSGDPPPIKRTPHSGWGLATLRSPCVCPPLQ